VAWFYVTFAQHSVSDTLFNRQIKQQSNSLTGLLQQLIFVWWEPPLREKPRTLAEKSRTVTVTGRRPLLLIQLGSGGVFDCGHWAAFLSSKYTTRGVPDTLFI
jgi:hypothetical protein